MVFAYISILWMLKEKVKEDKRLRMRVCSNESNRMYVDKFEQSSRWNIEINWKQK